MMQIYTDKKSSQDIGCFENLRHLIRELIAAVSPNVKSVQIRVTRIFRVPDRYFVRLPRSNMLLRMFMDIFDYFCIE
jgi:hypothetical protein